MKFLSMILIVCVPFLTLFSGIAKSIELDKESCCYRMNNNSCHNKGGKQSSDCDKSVCVMMFSGSICGFLTVKPLKVQPEFALNIRKPVALYKIGDLSDYHPTDWKPPKAC